MLLRLRKVVAVLLLFSGLVALTHAQEVPREVFTPPAGKGPSVVVLSGQSGPNAYRYFSARLADIGYAVSLVDGKNILFRTHGDLDPVGQANLVKAIAAASKDPTSSSDKVAVVGFSLGGGGALQWGASLVDQVSAIVAYYPAVSGRGQDMRQFAAVMQVPVLVLAGALDRYSNCCLVETMRTLEEEARLAKANFELHVYDQADHGFNLYGRTHSDAESKDAWTRTTAFLARYHAVARP